MAAATAARPTEKQIRFAESLLSQIDANVAGDPEAHEAWTQADRPAYETTIGTAPRKIVSQVIDQLIARRDASRPARAAAAPAATPVPEGIHYAGGIVFKVQRSMHGRLYAKQLNADAASFEYVGAGPLRNLSDSTMMTLADAEAFGSLYGVCARCGLLLTDEKSIARGVGPVCAKRF